MSCKILNRQTKLTWSTQVQYRFLLQKLHLPPTFLYIISRNASIFFLLQHTTLLKLINRLCWNIIHKYFLLDLQCQPKKRSHWASQLKYSYIYESIELRTYLPFLRIKKSCTQVRIPFFIIIIVTCLNKFFI